ncbi:MAG: nucleotidyl transferase AbiEii/AbiGii toxin family protein [Planctomycetes bacterium]|nr:nucleotidyl transferase AbiEii/AbiGii toxin family protein [Planctomycetota bacterium]
MSKSISDSIKARLLNKAKQRGEEFELYLVRYVCERFLFRLGNSSYKSDCTLKGAGLLAVWMDDPYRATRDVDLLARGDSDEAAVRRVIEEVCQVKCLEDGLVFDTSTLVVDPIREGQSYAGQRSVLRAYLGSAKIKLQVDIGFGDSMASGPETASIPTLLEHLPAPVVQVYPKVCTIAEKFEAMVQLGRRTSRMKDFHDLWAISDSFDFDGADLRSAIEQCFERRRTPWREQVPDVLTEEFYADDSLAARWQAYLNKGQFRLAPPNNFRQIGRRIQSFLGPIRVCILAREGFQGAWSKAGPWQ